MSGRTGRTVLRVSAIVVQWLALTTAVGSLMIRSDRSFEQLIDPHFGMAPVFIGAMFASFLLGLTIESPRYLAPAALLMCLFASAFIGILSYAPVVDGVLVRTTGLDDYVMQRVVLGTLILSMAAVPGAVAGNLLGLYLNVRQEIAPNPEDLADLDEVPWWEQRNTSDSESRPV